MLKATHGFKNAGRISAAQRIPVAGDVDSFEQRLHKQADTLKQLPGFVSYRLLRPIGPKDPFTVLTFWQTREAYEASYRPDLFLN